jgi:hypothetical protein
MWRPIRGRLGTMSEPHPVRVSYRSLNRKGTYSVPSPFRVRCRNCGRTVLSGVDRIGVAEANALSAHLETCRPDLANLRNDGWKSDLGEVLGHFDVRNTPGD